MQYLLDTHTFIWFINGDLTLPERVKTEIINVENRCFLSIASLWEMAIKLSLGKLTLSASFDNIAQFLSDNEIEILPIDLSHLQVLLTLDLSHKDPFDRIVISQAMAEDLILLSRDESFHYYPVKRLWE